MPLAFVETNSGAINLNHCFYLHRLASTWEAVSPGSRAGLRFNTAIDEASVLRFSRTLPTGWVEVFTLDEEYYFLNFNLVSNYWSVPDSKKGFRHFLSPVSGTGQMLPPDADLCVRLREELLKGLVDSAELPLNKRIRIGAEDLERLQR